MRQALLALALVLAIGACGDDGGATTSSSPAGSTTSLAVVTTSTSIATTSSVGPATSTTVDDHVEVEVVFADGSAEVTVDGVPETGRARIAIGDEVRITVTADVSSEVHLHGYDETVEVSPGSPAVIDFTANIPGIFELELHAGLTVLVELQVS